MPRTSAAESATILNVDDDEACRYALTRVLQRSKFVVREACNGEQALQIARAEHPDLVLLDINLPDMDGFEVCRRLKSDDITANIPVLHITASSQRPGDMARGLESGADSYLIEPVEPEVLVATINSTLRGRRAEEAARSLARQWQVTFDSIRDGVAVVDAEGRIQRCNTALSALLRHGAADLPGKSWSGLWENLPREKQPFFRTMNSRQREGVQLEYDSLVLNITADPMLDDTGKLSGAVMIVSDITEERRLEEQFQESQKFETIGTLAAGVAHDFNNLLTSIVGNASLLLTELPPNPIHLERLQDVLRAGKRAAELTSQLLAYSGRGRHFVQHVELSSLIRRSQELIEASVTKKVTVQLELAPDLPRIQADATQIQQLVLNLVSNAAEAIGEGPGSVIIRTSPGSGHVYLEVRDTGCGIAPDARAHIFEPFFSTKFTGRGLGLAAVAGIVRGHKATIEVVSTPGEGSTFRIGFPAAEESGAETAPAEGHVHTPAISRSGKILVVDDEDMVCRVAQAALESAGHEVLVAMNGAEAIAMVRKHPDISLVVLDLTMPVMGGAEAIDGIREAHAGIQVIVSTGYDHREAVARFRKKGVAAYLQKPYTARQLIERVNAVVGKKR